MIYYIDTVILNFHYFIPINLFLPFQIKTNNNKKTNTQTTAFKSVPHLVGILTRRYLSMAIASREKMELWVIIRIRQDRKRHV